MERLWARATPFLGAEPRSGNERYFWSGVKKGANSNKRNLAKSTSRVSEAETTDVPLTASF